MLLESIPYLKMLSVSCKSLRNLTPPKFIMNWKMLGTLKEQAKSNYSIQNLSNCQPGMMRSGKIYFYAVESVLCAVQTESRKTVCPEDLAGYLQKAFSVAPSVWALRSKDLWTLEKSQKIYKLCLQKGQEQELIL